MTKTDWVLFLSRLLLLIVLLVMVAAAFAETFHLPLIAGWFR